jgi:hypothetical protein
MYRPEHASQRPTRPKARVVRKRVKDAVQMGFARSLIRPFVDGVEWSVPIVVRAHATRKQVSVKEALLPSVVHKTA